MKKYWVVSTSQTIDNKSYFPGKIKKFSQKISTKNVNKNLSQKISTKNVNKNFSQKIQEKFQQKF